MYSGAAVCTGVAELQWGGGALGAGLADVGGVVEKSGLGARARAWAWVGVWGGLGVGVGLGRGVARGC